MELLQIPKPLSIFFSDFHFKYLGVRFPNFGFDSNSNFKISFQDYPSFFFNKAFWEFFSKRPKFSLLWRLCFVELFCWYELFMSVGAYTVAWGLRCLPHKMKCWHRKEETCSKQAVFAPAYNSMNARCLTVTVAQRLDRTRNTFRDKKTQIQLKP